MAFLTLTAAAAAGLVIAGRENRHPTTGEHHVVFSMHGNVTGERFEEFAGAIGVKALTFGEMKVSTGYVNDSTLAWLETQDGMVDLLSYEAGKDQIELFDVGLTCEDQRNGTWQSWGPIRTTQSGRVQGSYARPLGIGHYDKNWGAKVALYVVDSGVRPTQREFDGRKVYGRAGTRDLEDTHNHGTSCASQAGGDAFGIAPASTIISLNIFGDKFVDAFDFIVKDCEARKAAGTEAACVHTNSWGYTRLDEATVKIYDSILKELAKKGIHGFAAAGNSDGVIPSHAIPAISDGVSTVGAFEFEDVVAYYSCYGPKIDVWGPSTYTRAADGDSDGGVRYFSGTSSACPHVAGAAAAILSVDPDLSVAEVRELIKKWSLKGVLDVSSKPGTVNDGILQINCEKLAAVREARERRLNAGLAK